MEPQEASALLGLANLPILEEEVQKAYSSKMVELNNSSNIAGTGQGMEEIAAKKNKMTQARDVILKRIRENKNNFRPQPRQSAPSPARQHPAQPPVQQQPVQQQYGYQGHQHVSKQVLWTNLRDRLRDIIQSKGNKYSPDDSKIVVSILIAVIIVTIVFASARKPVTIPNDTVKSTTIVGVLSKARIRIFSEPPAKISIDGEKNGWAPMNQSISVVEGMHVIVLVDETGHEYMVKRKFEGGSSYRLFINLNENNVSIYETTKK